VETDGHMIVVQDLAKHYTVHEKDPGLAGSLRSFFKRKTRVVKAVDGVSFSLDAGEMVGFLGPNGAGKTTTLKMLAGLLHPSAGEVHVGRFTPKERRPDFLKLITLVMGQKQQLLWDLPAMDSFLVNQAIYEVPDGEFQVTMREFSDILELEGILKKQVRKLSLGERMKCELAAALLHRPDVLFLDEPTIGLDVVMQQKIREFIGTYQEQHQATILLTSHYMDDVKALCERVVVIDQGKVIYDGALRELARRFGDAKLLTLDLDAPTTREELAGLAGQADIVAWEPHNVSLRVPRAAVSATAARLLAQLQVRDLAIQEPEVEEVIRSLFSGQLREPAESAVPSTER
jgi:ABC-2 type transport system ATP-binding protein